jgi:hypothetical protein
MIKKLTPAIFLYAIFLVHPALAQMVSIDNFIIKESLTDNSKIAVIAADSSGTARENVNGVFTFTINGFKEELLFTNGVATPSGQIDKSAFVYLKHLNDKGAHSVLYYVIKANGSLKPFRINWFLLLIVPVVLIVLGMMFRKFIIIALILLTALFIFNHTKGLGFFTFFENIYNGVKAMF